jgi:hypothetical protein
MQKEDLEHMLKRFYSTASPKTFIYDYSNKNRTFIRRSPLKIACAVISFFIIITAVYLGISYKKGKEKILDNNQTDKEIRYLSFGPMQFTSLFEFLNYASLDFSLVDEEKVFIPQLPVPCRNIITHIFKKNDYKIICVGTINNKVFSMHVRFTELDVAEDKEWFEMCDNVGETKIRDYKGVKLEIAIMSRFYKFNTFIISYFCFSEQRNMICGKVISNVAMNFLSCQWWKQIITNFMIFSSLIAQPIDYTH